MVQSQSTYIFFGNIMNFFLKDKNKEKDLKNFFPLLKR